MQLRYLKSIRDAAGDAPAEGDLPQRVVALSWAPNGSRLAAATSDRQILLFDDAGTQRDRFSLKPAGKTGAKDFLIRGIEFSPDSTKLAVAQTDNVVFVYNLGGTWDDRKTVCNKFPSKSPCTSLTWPSLRPDELVYGSAEGKLRVGLLRNNKSATLFDADSAVVAMAAGPDGHSFASAHADGNIYRYTFPTGSSPATKALVVRLAFAPYCLAWSTSALVAAGNADVVQFFSAQGDLLQRFKFEPGGDNLKEFTGAAFAPSGKGVVLGNYHQFVSFAWSEQQGRWERVPSPRMENLYTITAVQWKADGSRLVTASMTGAIDVFDSCLRRYTYRQTFEVTFTSLSSLIVRHLTKGALSITIASRATSPIVKVDIYHDRYVIARTRDTLIAGDMVTQATSEVRGLGVTGTASNAKTKFVFGSPGVVMVFSAGELSIVAFGNDNVIGSCRTEHASTHLVSLRIDKARGKYTTDVKRIAYLLDLQTIVILDLESGVTIATVNHDADIDWLEMNGRATKLLFRDRHRILHLFDVERQHRTTLSSFANYAQWVPDADVVVAQNRTNLLVWYNIDQTEQLTTIPIKGDVLQIERANGATTVTVDEGGGQRQRYPLDESLISFGAAVESGQYEQVVAALERVGEESPESESMWARVAALALSDGNLAVAERCYVALGDMSRARAVHSIARQSERLGASSPDVQAALALLSGNVLRAEAILVGAGRIEDAIDMYIRLHKWENALAIAEARGYTGLDALRKRYFEVLVASGQEVKAGDLLERQGDHVGAIHLYIKGGGAAHAAALVVQHGLTSDTTLMEQIVSGLISGGLLEKAGDFMQDLGMLERALAAYQDGHAYGRAIDLCRRAFPARVVQVEEMWGDHLATLGHWDAASNHFIEAARYVKAINAAIEARQYGKAAQILGNIDADQARPFFKRIADQLVQAGRFRDAERQYVQGGMPLTAVQMWLSQGALDDAHRVAVGSLSDAEIRSAYTAQARALMASGDLSSAERLFVSMGDPMQAADMYRQAGRQDDLLRVIQRHRPDLLQETHARLAQDAVQSANYATAEAHLVKCGQWKAAVDMYRERASWDDAMRVAKQHGGQAAYEVVACAYASRLAPDASIAFLVSRGLVDRAVDAALERHDFAEAFRIGAAAAPGKLSDVHLQLAMSLEDDGRFDQAETEFVAAGKPREAIDMWMHQQEWARALQVAQAHDAGAVNDVHVAHGAAREQRQERPAAEALYVAGGRVDLAVTMYRNARMWDEAVRCAKASGRPDLVADLPATRPQGVPVPATPVAVVVQPVLIPSAVVQAPDAVAATHPVPASADAQLEALAARGDWPQVYQLATGANIAKYAMVHVQKLVRASAWQDAVQVLLEHGIPPGVEHAPLYKHLARQVIQGAMTPASGSDAGAGTLRAFLEQVVLPGAALAPGSPDHAEITRLAFIAHLLAVRAKADAMGLKRVVAKIAVALLRYVGEVPVDKAFYEAGKACEAADWSNMAFVFYNRFVDICDLVDDPDHGDVDNADFLETDIPAPNQIAMPTDLSYTTDARERIRDWVLETAMSNTNSQALTQRTCESCGTRTYTATLECHGCHRRLPPCIVTGYPVLDSSKVECGACHKLANRDDWNRFVTKAKACPWCGSDAKPF